MEKINIKGFNPCKEGLKYYESKASYEQAWNDCECGDWMLWIAYKLGVDDRIHTRAKALCANTIRRLMTDKRSTDAIDAALRYADGKISREELNKYAADAAAAFADADAASSVYADAAAAAAAVAVVYASSAASSAYADAAAGIFDISRKDNQLATANICRKVLTEAVFEKARILMKNTNRNESV
jgi:hypothetical protein